jgi:hypothetical protein
MTPISTDEVTRPTTTESPLPLGASVSALPANPAAALPVMPAKVYSIDVMAMARIPDIPAIEFFIEEWLELGVERASSLDDLLRDYKAMRAEHSFLPPVSKKRLSQLLVKHGCRKFISDEKDSEGQRHRVVFFDVRQGRRADARRAA